MAGPDILLELARTIGTHPAQIALWSEGSCAIRLSAERFLVTRSGTCLARIAESDLVEIDAVAARALLEREELPEEGMAGVVVNPAGAEPSTDTLIYAQLFEMEGVTLSAHTQPIEVNQIISSPRARQFADRRTTAEEVVSCGASSVLVPYADPGLALAREVKRKIMLWRDRHKFVPSLLLLQNHGMIVLGDNQEDLLRCTELTIKCARVFIGSAAMGGPMFLSPNNVAFIDELKGL